MSDITAISTTLRVELVPDDPALFPVRLVFGPRLIIGRNQEECDLVSWFLPRGEENDAETLRLSQVHCFLERESNFIRIRDADSARGTFWNGHPAPAGEGQSVPLGLDGKLSLGRNFHISIEWMPAGQPVSAVLRPLVSEPAFRNCLWMSAARCGFVVRKEDRLVWLHPAGVGEAADVTAEARGRKLWWCPADEKPAAIEDGVKLSAAGVVLQAHIV